jgi:hypothetical protein
LVLRRDDVPKELELATVVSEIEGMFAAVDPRDLEGRDLEATWFNFGSAALIQPNLTNGWEFKSGFWPATGLTGTERETNRKIRLAWETHFAQWYVRNLIQLPDDKVIFQLGDTQICVLDPQTRRVALLARGRGPAVLFK